MTLKGLFATRGTFASAYISKDKSRPNAYCAKTLSDAKRRANGYKDIAMCTSVAKGTTCAAAKTAAKKLVTAKCKPCMGYTNDAGAHSRESGLTTILRIDGRGKRTPVATLPTDKAFKMLRRLESKACPRGHR